MAAPTSVLKKLGALAAGLCARALHRLPGGQARPRAKEGLFASRPGAFHAPNHTWLAPRGPAELMLGIDGLWFEIIPPVTRVELPRPGTILRRGEPVAVLHAGGRSVPIEAPLNGMVVRTNPRVAADPALLARDPYGEGWLFSATPADESYKKLPAGSAAASWLLAEADRLERFLALERSKGGGGEFLASAAAALDEEGFRRLARAFLHA